VYKYELLGIFLDTMDDGLVKLKKHIKESGDMDATFKQAHALKSSAGVIKVKDMHAQLARIEELGRADTGKDEIEQLFDSLEETYSVARPILVKTRAANKPAE